MATFVIVHGGFGGAWEWTSVARLLRRLGHDVYTPTLSGLGERSHLASAATIGLAAQVDDIVGLIEIEDLHDVVLCASDFGGVPATVAADRVSSRLSMLVYIDALVPCDGEAAVDLLPTDFAMFVQEGLTEHGERWRVPAIVDPLPAPGWQTAAQMAAYRRKLRDQPVMTFIEPAYLTGAVDFVQRVFVRCTMRADFADLLDVDPIRLVAWRAKMNGWQYDELAAGHDPHLTEPLATANHLAALAGSVPSHASAVPPELVRHLPKQRQSGLDSQNWAWN
ncbi:MAG TPA: alpha/beta fold hydrolase [Nocardioidaceae bacterium]|jgi:pimeloyl-ACP methyl ester carboxylesterase